MKYYLNIVGMFLFFCLTIGYAIPTAVSAKDTLMVLGGLGWAIASPVVLWYWLRAAFLPKKKENKDVTQS